MSVALLLITHEHIAHNLITTAQNILNTEIENIAAVEVPMDIPIDEIKTRTTEQLSELNHNDGLLIITDLIGSTPFNIASQIQSEQNNTALISGLNLPMLLKLSNYRELTLIELTEKAITGGRSGIVKHE